MISSLRTLVKAAGEKSGTHREPGALTKRTATAQEPQLMLLLGHLAKIQGLKGEFLLHAVMDEPERLPELQGPGAGPAGTGPEQAAAARPPARPVTLRSFRWHQDRPCVAFQELPDRTAAEPFKGWALWMPEDQAVLNEGESFRHDWVGCEVFVAGREGRRGGAPGPHPHGLRHGPHAGSAPRPHRSPGDPLHQGLVHPGPARAAASTWIPPRASWTWIGWTDSVLFAIE